METTQQELALGALVLAQWHRLIAAEMRRKGTRKGTVGDVLTEDDLQRLLEQALVEEGWPGDKEFDPFKVQCELEQVE